MERDDESGLAYHGARYYSPWLGRWTAADPLRVHSSGEGDLNVYRYGEGRVVVATDPTGLEIVISAQNEAEYGTGIKGTAVALLEAMRDEGWLRESELQAAVGEHRRSSDLDTQVLAKPDGSVRRIDSFGHTASGFSFPSGSSYPVNWRFAERIKDKMQSGAMIVIHGCGPPSGVHHGMQQFLEALGKPVTVYAHRNTSGPGMPMNWVAVTLEVKDGKQIVSSRELVADDRVIGTILPESYVRWWASQQTAGKLRAFLADRFSFRFTNDVRAVVFDVYCGKIGAQQAKLEWHTRLGVPDRPRTQGPGQTGGQGKGQSGAPVPVQPTGGQSAPASPGGSEGVAGGGHSHWSDARRFDLRVYDA